MFYIQVARQVNKLMLTSTDNVWRQNKKFLILVLVIEIYFIFARDDLDHDHHYVYLGHQSVKLMCSISANTLSQISALIKYLDLKSAALNSTTFL